MLASLKISTKKKVVYDERAYESLLKLPIFIQDEFRAMFRALEMEGRLVEPDAKKLDNNLYEIRIRVKTAWRAFYAYLIEDEIIILHIFQKQTQKTPEKELRTAEKRLKQYI